VLHAAAIDGRLAVVCSTVPIDAASPVHVHQREAEIVVLLSGGGIFWVGHDRYEVAEGGLIQR
jgi:uncharacterized cupin superfamily protein